MRSSLFYCARRISAQKSDEFVIRKDVQQVATKLEGRFSLPNDEVSQLITLMIPMFFVQYIVLEFEFRYQTYGIQDIDTCSKLVNIHNYANSAHLVFCRSSVYIPDIVASGSMPPQSDRYSGLQPHIAFRTCYIFYVSYHLNSERIFRAWKKQHNLQHSSKE